MISKYLPRLSKVGSLLLAFMSVVQSRNRSAKNRAARLKFAKRHLSWTNKEWEKVVWSDESKFLLFGTDGISFVRRPIGKRFHPRYQLPTVKHGGGLVMVRGCFSLGKMGPLHRVDGIMDRHVYMKILKDKLLPYVRRWMAPGWIFSKIMTQSILQVV